jgi:aspartyl-tRNA(Asn)/glutamyl-tRNA(Gln) amidotransferase subunit A
MERILRRVVCGVVGVVMGVGAGRAQTGDGVPAGLAHWLEPNQTDPPVALPSGLPVLSAEEQAGMDRELMEIDIPRLQDLYRRHVYTVEQVTRWYLGRIAKYNGVYRDVQTVDVKGALETARLEDKGGGVHGALWGVPMVIKANTAVKGLLDTDGWAGFAIPGHEFVAERDATVVAKLRAAGAVILGITNMPDFAIADTTRSTAFGRTGNAYDVRFSPGGSSGGTVTAVTSNEAMAGTGSDTACSITMPAGTSSVVGVLPTRGLTSIAGIAPLDWLRDNTGPVARNVTDAAIVLGVMAGEDALDFRTKGSEEKAEVGPYTRYLKKDALRGKRFGVPSFLLETQEDKLQPETRAMLMKAVEQLRAAGAEVVIDEKLLPMRFDADARKMLTRMYVQDGADQWIAAYGPKEYRSAAEYTAATGVAWPVVFEGRYWVTASMQPQRVLATDPDAEKNVWGPQRAALAEYDAALDAFHLDGLVYPSAQMPPPDETMAQNGGLTTGPESHTGWVNRLGVPAVVVPGGFYADGLPFGLEISGRRWRDGDLLGWAYAYEQATKNRRPPVLVEKGLLPIGR